MTNDRLRQSLSLVLASLVILLGSGLMLFT